MARVRLDAVSAGAVEVARAAAVEVAGEQNVGEHLRARAESDRLVSHTFACLAKGYPGWEWTVTVARAPRAKVVTVCEVELMATPEAVTAPTWVPWAERVTPGDLGPGDVLPQADPDERLDPGYAATGEEDVDQLALWELGLGRRRVLSREGRQDASARWQHGDYGPTSTMARQATQKCRECGFLLPISGVLRQNFGVCTNEWSPADGRVISLDYGCGAHSEQQVPPAQPPRTPLIDDLQVDLLARPAAGDEESAVDAQAESAESSELAGSPGSAESSGLAGSSEQAGPSEQAGLSESVEASESVEVAEPVAVSEPAAESAGASESAEASGPDVVAPVEEPSEPAAEPGAEVVLVSVGQLADRSAPGAAPVVQPTGQGADPVEETPAQVQAPAAADMTGSLLDQVPLQGQLELDGHLEPAPEPGQDAADSAPELPDPAQAD